MATVKPGGDATEKELDELRREVETLRARIAQFEAIPVLTGEDTSEQLFAALLQLPLLFYRIDGDGRFRHVAGRAIERIGIHDATSLVGREVLDLFPEARTEFLQSLAGNAVWSEISGEVDGHPWAAMSFVSPAEDGDGTVGVSLDVTEWKLARAELAASERRFRSLAETVAVAISRTDPVGTLVYANEPMGRFLGVPTGELIGRNSLEFVVPEDQARVVEEWTAAQSNNSNYSGKFRVRNSKGDSFWVLSRTAVEFNENGEVTGFVSSLMDITESRKTEEELSARVAERTAQLVQANRELESFCYSVSHDLRAPLRSIDGFCHLLREELGGAATKESAEYLGRVIEASKRMDRLIDDFLVLSRSSLATVHRHPVDLGAIAREVAAGLTASAPERSVQFDIAPELLANGDPGLLRDVFENLLGNAFKFTRKTETARIEVFATTTRQGESAFAVRDNGVGFRMDHAAKVFTAFHRLHDDSDFEGTGVGLATVDRIIRRHGGKVFAEAAPGQGATFFFTLPSA